MTTGRRRAATKPRECRWDLLLGYREVPLEQQQKTSPGLVRDGGIGRAHAALTGFESWPESRALLGGRYDEHPWDTANGTILNEDPAFPATRHLPASFPFVDEFYQTKAFSRDRIRVLLRLDVSKMPPNPGVHRTDGDFPLAWAKMYGKGRVFYSSLGHAASTWDNPDVYHMYFEALKWSLGLTDADVTPRPLAK
jgi:type 1 glutamine amidotransferase